MKYLKALRNHPCLFLLIMSIGFTVLIFIPYSLSIESSLPNALDPLFYTWNILFNTQKIGVSLPSMLNAPIFWPMPNTIAFSDTLWSYTVPALLLQKIFNNPVLVQNILALSTYPLAAISMYFLIRYFLPENTFAALMGGILYAFCYPRLAQIGHLPALSNQFIPLLFLYLLRFIDTGKTLYILLLGLFTLITISASIYHLIFLIPFLFIIGIIQIPIWIRNRNWDILRQRFITGGITFIPFIIVGYLLLYPYFILRIQHPEFQRSLYDIHFLRAGLTDYISVLPSSILHSLGYISAETEHILYPTVSLMTLAVLGITIMKKKNFRLFTMVLGIILTSFILSLGDEIQIPFTNQALKLPYYYLFTYTPFFKTVRVPARIAIFLFIGLTIIASYGIDRLKNKPRLVIVFFILFLFEIWQFNTPKIEISPLNQRPKIYTYFENKPECYPIVFLPLRRFWRGSPMEDQLYKKYDQISEYDNYLADIYRIYFNSYSDCPTVNGYSGFFPPVYTKIAESLEQFPNGNGVEELKNVGVKYIVGNASMYGISPNTLIKNWSIRQDISFIGIFGTDVLYEIQYENNDKRLKSIPK